MATPAPTFLTIPSKPTAPISYTFFPSSSALAPPTTILILFINGLGLPAAAWIPSISLLRSTHPSAAILAYDRFGQGLTKSKDPLDSSSGKENGHSFADVVDDLHEIILAIASSKLSLNSREVENGKLELVMVGNSIGVPIIRLYVQKYGGVGGVVAGAVFLDSNICNVNYSDFWPDPDAEGFEPEMVVDEDCTLEVYRKQRKAICGMFDLGVKNPENLDRTTGATLLPLSDGPKLTRRDGKGVWLSVVGHDPETFAQMSFERMGTPKSLSEKFSNKYWASYNKDLTEITDENRCEGVVIAKGCGHFIQMDDPAFVAGEVGKMLERLGW